MKTTLALLFAAILFLALPLASQTPAAQVVPPLIHFSNVATDESGTPLAGQAKITFSLYTAQKGGEPLWTETQNVQLTPEGNYDVQLGATKKTGVPPSLFVSGQARWLGVQIGEQAEQPRVLLLSVPYALKAADAETIGGLPPSAFVLAVPSAAGSSPTEGANTAVSPAVSGTGTANFLPLWLDSSGTLGNSVLFQSGSGATAKIGINTNTPASTLDVKGAATFRGTLALPASGNANAAGGKNSQPQNFVASAYDSSANKPTAETFQLQAEAAGNDTTTPTATLNLLFGAGANKPTETGLNIASNGLITFAPGQTFPSTGITEVDAGSGLKGGGTGSKIELDLDTVFTDARYPQLSSSNRFAGSQTITGDVISTGQLVTSVASGTSPLLVNSTTQVTNLNASFLGGLSSSSFAQLTLPNTFAASQNINGSLVLNGSGNLVLPATTSIGSGVIVVNSSPFLHSFGSVDNVFLGVGAGNFTASTGRNTVVGFNALHGATTNGGQNTAVGSEALLINTEGVGNSAVGVDALAGNTTGTFNVAIGQQAGQGSSTGSSNTFVGVLASADPNVSNISNATAIGQRAVVGASNAMVLGGTGANAPKVGIGTSKPAVLLDVVAGTTGNHAPIGQFGSTGLSDGNSMRTYNGTGLTDVFTAGAANTFVTGSKTGDGGLRVNPGQSILFGDSALARMTIDASGNVKVTGNLSKGGGSFKIDHPLDPLNKYLYHSFVESPDMMNVYNGNVTTNKKGEAVVTLPDYFESLNRDFRYQVTVIGQFAQAIVAQKISHNRFVIKTSKPSVEVSWQITGIRQDAYANAHRIPVEEEKQGTDRGAYLHPDAYAPHATEAPTVAEVLSH